MALPDYFRLSVGTALSWKNTGGDYTLTLTSLANNAARQGGKGDLGANRARLYAALFTSSVGSAATTGNEIEVYWGASPSTTAGTDNPGSLGGSDAALTTPDEYKLQLMPLGALPLSNTAGTNVQKVILGPFVPPARYGMPVIVNKSGQTMGGTAGDHEFRLLPILESVEDTTA